MKRPGNLIVHFSTDVMGIADKPFSVPVFVNLLMNYRRLILTLLLGLALPLNVYAQDDPDKKTKDATARGDEAGSNDNKRPAEIYLAAKEGRLEKLKSLIASGADINAVNTHGRSALMGAVYVRNRRIVRELLLEGANVNTVDAQGRSALMIAVTTGDHEIVQMLVDAGADISMEDKNKNTAITLAERRKDKKLQKLLDAASS